MVDWGTLTGGVVSPLPVILVAAAGVIAVLVVTVVVAVVRAGAGTGGQGGEDDDWSMKNDKLKSLLREYIVCRRILKG